MPFVMEFAIWNFSKLYMFKLCGVFNFFFFGGGGGGGGVALDLNILSCKKWCLEISYIGSQSNLDN